MPCVNDTVTPKGVKISFNSGSEYTNCTVYTGLTSNTITGVTSCSGMTYGNYCDLTGIDATLLEIYVKIDCEGCCEQTFRVNLDDCCDNIEVSPTPTPTVTPSMTATPVASVSVTPTPTPTMTPTPSLAPCYELVSINVISSGTIIYTDCCGVVQEESVTTGEYLIPACVQTNSISAITAVIDTNIDYTTGIPCVCPTPTPSVTPTATPTSTPLFESVSVTPSNTMTPTPTPTPTTPPCECNTYLIEFSSECAEPINWTNCDTGMVMSEQGLYFGFPSDTFQSGDSVTLCSCTLPTVTCPNVVITLSASGCEAYRYYEVMEVNDCATGSVIDETYIVRSSAILLVGEFINATIVPTPPTCAWKVISEVPGPLYDGVVTSSCGTALPVACCC